MDALSAEKGTIAAASPLLPLICIRSTEYRSQRHNASHNPSRFAAFRQWQSGPAASEGIDGVVQQLTVLALSSTAISRDARPYNGSSFVMQLVRHPQMKSTHPTLRTVRWFIHEADKPGFTELPSCPTECNRANDFFNLKCECSGCGEGKGWYNELNVFVVSGSQPSHHHESTVHGVIAPRNTNDDGVGTESTKGPHWVHP